MPAFGLSALVYLAIQAFVARFVYREASAHGRSSSLALAGGVFVLSIVAPFVVNSILLVLLVQALAIAMYRVGASSGRPATPR